MTEPVLQVPPTAGVVATSTPAGSRSSIACASVCAPAFALPSVMVRREVPLGEMVGGTKVFSTVGGWSTRTVAVAGSGLLTPSLLVSPPVGMVLV